ncbi:MAG: hypothetical protein Q4A40_02340 [Bacillota bacterium]|nr:hypothetical protein [Bacillota bacterium]
MITAIATLIGSVISGLTALFVASIQNNKTTALIVYRLEQLEKKVELHNNAVLRLTAVERDLKTVYRLVDDISDDLRD